VQRQVAAVDAVFGKVACADAGALNDPGIAGFQPAPASMRAMSSLDKRRGGR
jgi:hypothetical protein